MTSWLLRYREHLQELHPENPESLFSERIERFRQGDEMAGREISGAYLERVLDWVQTFPRLPRSLTLSETLEEANVGLVDAIRSFTGSTADEFWQHARRTIILWLNFTDDK